LNIYDQQKKVDWRVGGGWERGNEGGWEKHGMLGINK
jgi:hypothetical protein